MISNEPERTLPHRAPFVWVSRLMERAADGKSGVCELDLPVSLDVFKGHFPGAPIFPGVLQLEAAAQACLWVSKGVLPPGSSLPDVRFVGVEKFKFKRPVTPPSTLSIRGKELAMKRGLYLWEIEISCQGQTVSEGQIWTWMKEE